MGEFLAGNSDSTLKECVLKAIRTGNGAMEVTINNTETFILQTKEKCYNCDRVFFELTASAFSFNNPESMCPVCKGLGVKLEVDAGLIISNPNLSILDGASEWWGNLRKHMKNPNANWMRGEVIALAEDMKVDIELPWKELPDSFRKQALYGSDGRAVTLVYENTNGRRGEIIRPVEGAYNAITRLFRENNGDTANRIAASFMRESKCSGCHGERLSAEGRLVSVAGKRFPETVAMTIEQLENWIITLPQLLSEYQLAVCSQILREIKKRAGHLADVGVSYLSLDRPVPSLSGGEAQRLRLASQLGSGITNILYVFDEPSIGLHPKDHGKLIRIMQKLRDCGNTVIVVEHDAQMMLSADKIIDIGPGAGDYGGKIVAEGTPNEITNNPNSKTGEYLRNMKGPIEDRISPRRAIEWINIKGARCNNLKNIDVSIPLGVMTCVTGVSGSGKSSLIIKTLYPALARLINKSEDAAGEYDSITGTESIENIIAVSQQPIGRTPRSNPATYTGVFDDIRSLFAELLQSKQKGYKSNKFSFNSKEGQCEVCGGEGRRCLEMHFMPDVWVECPVCHGKRFNKEALEIRYNGKTIADVLDMSVSQALSQFENSIKISKVLQTLNDVGLGYIKLGQSALTLSGGEAQRIKLARELCKENPGKTLYLLDEPTTGLHFADVENLIKILRKITDAGHTVLVIEHNLDIIKNSDWIIDLGPEGGDAGGFVVAQGTPIEVAQVSESYTGKYLKSMLGPVIK
jgi:excinuclease ABC subunit A